MSISTKRRINKNDLTAWFLEDHATLPVDYVKSCEDFFEELGCKRGKLQAIDETVPYNDIEEAQATSGKRCNLFMTMLEKKTERENKK